MDQRAEGLRQHHRQAAVDQPGMRGSPLPARARARRARALEGHQRVEADQQVQPSSSSTDACSVFFSAPSTKRAADLHRRNSPAAPGSPAPPARSAPVPAGQPKGALAAVQVGGHQHQRRRSWRKSLVRPGCANWRPAAPSMPVLRRCRWAARDPAARAASRSPSGAAARPPQRLRRHLRQRGNPQRANSPQAGRISSAGARRCRARALVLDERGALLARAHAVGQRRGDEAAGRHADVGVAVGQVEPGWPLPARTARRARRWPRAGRRRPGCRCGTSLAVAIAVWGAARR